MVTALELEAIPIFHCLTEAHRQSIASRAAELNVQAGEWIIREGETPSFYVLLEGALEIEKEYGGESRVRARYQPGDFYGETPLLLDAPTIASLRASQPSRLIRLDRGQFKEILDASPECANLIVQTMTKRLDTMREFMRENNPLRVRIVGSAHDTDCRGVRSFLALNRIPYEWLDSEKEDIRLSVSVPSDLPQPYAVIDDSILIGDPLTVRKVAEALGIRTAPSKNVYDVTIIGGGPAGLAAAVYGASEGLSVLLVEKSGTGGQAGTSSRIENYLGFPNGISGDELASRALKQASRFGSEMVMTRKVQGIHQAGDKYRVTLDCDDTSVLTSAIVIASGVEWRRLSASGIERLSGRGVLYGAAKTEAPTVIRKSVFIVGGGNSAGQAAMFFSSYAETVTLLVRGPGLSASMSQYLIAQLAQRKNISIEPNTEVVSAGGENSLESVCTSTLGRIQTRRADALFVMIGADADTAWLPEALQRDKQGFICTGRDVTAEAGQRSPFALETNLSGIFCAGDVRHNSIKRVASAVGEGSMAISFVHQYLAMFGGHLGATLTAEAPQGLQQQVRSE